MNRLAIAPTTLPDTPPLVYLEAAAAAGFGTVGLRLNRSPGLPFAPVLGDRALVGAIKQTLARSNLEVLDIYSFYLEPTTAVAQFAPALALGAELGAKYAVVMGADSEWSRLTENFVRICRLAAEHGLVCTIESAVIRPLANLPQALRLVAESGCTNVAICIDPLNFARAGDSIAQLQQTDPRLLPYAQITDGVIGADEPNPALLGRMSPNQRRLLGEGNVPLGEILSALPPEVPLSIELPPPEGGYDPMAWATRVRTNVESYLAWLPTAPS
jgi:sugar phosphate isomerase/epimerase